MAAKKQHKYRVVSHDVAGYAYGDTVTVPDELAPLTAGLISSLVASGHLIDEPTKRGASRGDTDA